MDSSPSKRFNFSTTICLALFLINFTFDKNYLEATYFFNNPLFKILAIMLFFVGFFHAKISLIEIFEDYIHDKKIKNVENILVLLLSILIPLITVVLLLYKL